MKKTYEKPKIEAVTYAANTSLCGSCGDVMDRENIDYIAALLEVWYDPNDENSINPEYFLAEVATPSNPFFAGAEDRCSVAIADGMYCKFTISGNYFLS